MASLIQDPFEAEKMGREARAVFRERFTLDAMIGAYESLYDETIAARRAPQASSLQVEAVQS